MIRKDDQAGPFVQADFRINSVFVHLINVYQFPTLFILHPPEN